MVKREFNVSVITSKVVPASSLNVVIPDPTNPPDTVSLVHEVLDKNGFLTWGNLLYERIKTDNPSNQPRIFTFRKIRNGLPETQPDWDRVWGLENPFSIPIWIGLPVKKERLYQTTRIKPFFNGWLPGKKEGRKAKVF